MNELENTPFAILAFNIKNELLKTVMRHPHCPKLQDYPEFLIISAARLLLVTRLSYILENKRIKIPLNYMSLRKLP